MRYNANTLFIFLIILCSHPVCFGLQPVWQTTDCVPSLSTFSWTKKTISSGIKTIAETVMLLHWHLFSFDSFKIISAASPFYCVTRGFDETVQDNFFDHTTKKNKNNPPKWCSQLARFSIAIPIAYFGAQAFLSRDDEFRITCQTFLLGLPFVLIAKDIIKRLKFEANLRPYHEKFSPHKRCGGGFPSGHMAEAVYTTALFGMRFGKRYVVPLSLIAGFLAIMFVSCNRHYLSQVVAGAAFGTLYAFSANKIVDYRLSLKQKEKENYQLHFTYENQKPGVCFAFQF
jgi:membrane-associated phospholipid phosphatase